MCKKDYIFRDIQITDPEKIESVILINDNTLYARTFHVMFLWKDLWELSVCADDDFFTARAVINGKIAYFFPCGTEQKKKDFLSWFIKEKSHNCILCNISQSDKCFFEEHFGGALPLKTVREDFAYIYSRAEQLEMSGKKYKNMKRSLHKVKRGHEWVAQRINSSNFSDVQLILQNWIDNTFTDFYDLKSVDLAVNHFFDLGMFGVVLYRDGSPLGFAMGSFTGNNTFDLNISKTLVPNIDIVLRNELFKLLPENVTYIDQEDDMGIEGLRIHKTQLVPCNILRVYEYCPD